MFIHYNIKTLNTIGQYLMGLAGDQNNNIFYILQTFSYRQVRHVNLKMVVCHGP